MMDSSLITVFASFLRAFQILIIFVISSNFKQCSIFCDRQFVPEIVPARVY